MKKSGKNCSIFFLLAAIVSSNFLSVYAEDEIYINAPGSGNVIINNTEGEITYGVRGENQPDQFFDCWNNGSTTRKGTVETGYLPSDTNRENKVFVLKVDKYAGEKTTVSGGFNYVFPEYTAEENGIVHFSYRQYLDFDGSIPLYGAGYNTEGLACLSYDKNAHEGGWAGSYDSGNPETSKDIVRIGKVGEKMKVYPRKNNLGTEVGAFINGWNKFDYVMNFTSGKVDVYLNGTKVVSGIDTISSNMSVTDVLRKIQTNYTGITAEGNAYDQGYHYAYYDDFLLETVAPFQVYSEMSPANVPNSGIEIKFTTPVEKDNLENMLTLKHLTKTVESEIIMSDDNMTAAIRQQGGFVSEGEYSIAISKELTDIYGQALNSDYTCSFTAQKSYAQGKIIINNTEGEITYGVRGENQPDQFFDTFNNTGSTTRKGTVETGYLPSDTNRENKVFVLKVDKYAGEKTTVSGGFNYVFPEYTAEENGIVHFSYRQYLDFDGSIPLYGAGYNTEGLACLSYDKNAHEGGWAGSYDSGNPETSKDIVRIGKVGEKMKVYPRKNNLGTEVGAFINGWNKFDYVMNFTSGKVDVYLNGTKVVSGIDTISSNMSVTDVLRKIQTNYTGITAEGNAYDQGYHYAYYDDFLLETVAPFQVYSEMNPVNVPNSGIEIKFTTPVEKAVADEAVKLVKNGEIVETEITMSEDNKSMTVKEAGGFGMKQRYTLTVDSSKLTDKFGQKTAQDFVIDFVSNNVSDDGISIDGNYTKTDKGILPSITVGNVSYSGSTALIIVGVYDSETNELIGCEMKNVNIPIGTSVNVNDAIEVSRTNYYVKAIVWDSIDNILPIAPAQTLELLQ